MRRVIRLDLDVQDVFGIDVRRGANGAADRDLHDPVHRPDRAGVGGPLIVTRAAGAFASTEAIQDLGWDGAAGGGLAVKLQFREISSPTYS